MRKRIITVVICTLVVAGFVLFAAVNTNHKGANRTYSRAQIAKMFTLLLESEDNVQETIYSMNYEDVNEKDWFAKYMQEAFRLGILTPSQKSGYARPKEAITYKEAEGIFANFGLEPAQFEISLDSDKKLSADEVNKIYAAILEKESEKALVHKKNVYIYQYDNDNKVIKTNLGEYSTVGYDMSKWEQQCATIYTQSSICTLPANLFDGELVLKNIWCIGYEDGGLNICDKGLMASLKSDLTSGKEYENQLVDIVLDKGNIAVVHKKTDLISGKVLSIDSSHVELSGQQVYEMEKGAPVYRLYGEVGASDISHVMVGYDGASFAIEQGRVTAILLNERVMAKHIRVLINTTGYEAKFHQSVEVTSTKDYKVTIGDNETVYPAGQSYKVNKDDVLSGRITIEPSVGGLLELKSVERAYGNPSYHGTLEINSLPEGLVVVNELDVEEYLYSVIPSEMPIAYGLEALKVQAVCARSYAYSQMLNASFAQYGAHLDDSVSSQVYNNSKECTESIKAVEATAGKVLYSGDKVANAYFFSTSCGHTGDSGDVWIGGGSNKTLKYLTGRLQTAEPKQLRLDDEAAFQQFIDDVDAYDFFEKDVNWFRWTVTMTKKQLENSINANLSSVGSLVTMQNKDGDFVKADVKTIGKLKDISIKNRGSSGVAKSLLVTGSKAVIQVSSEYAIRKLLGNIDVAITLKDGSRTNQAILPSGYFYISKSVNEKGKNSQYSFNGGGYGHGVGMSQNGVKAMCERGYSFKKILKHYYPKTELKDMY